MYEEESSHPNKPKADLRRLARGEKITVSEWVRRKPKLPNGRRLPVCLKKNGELRCIATFLVPAKFRGMTRSFSVTPILNGSDSAIKEVKQDEELPDRESRFFSIKFAFKETLPDVVGRHSLKLEWRIDGHRFRVFKDGKWKVTDSAVSDQVIYTIFGPPLRPAAYEIVDSAASPDDGTRTGTEKRFEILMSSFGSKKQHPASSEQDRIDLCWKLHNAINNSNPPYFDGRNTEILTTDAFPEFDIKTTPRKDWPEKKFIAVDDQWLMWVKTKAEKKPIDPKDKGKKRPKPRHWNDASCIGHAQLQKTMMASIGMFGRLAWVFPHTTQAPLSGNNPTGEKNHGERLPILADEDLFALVADLSAAEEKLQKWNFRTKLLDEDGKPDLDGDGKQKKKWLSAQVVLMHGNARRHENFEGCLLTNDNRFLTGGFPTAAVKVKSFHANKGFLKATDLLSWWTTLKEAGGRRFLCWVAIDPDTTTDPDTKRPYYFDRFGDQHYRPIDIRRKKLDLKWEP